MGLVLVEKTGSLNQPQFRYYQHPSWKKGGWLAPIVLDETGALFTAPAPFINMLDNPLSGQNTIYRVDAQSGIMDEFLRLPVPDSLTATNAYGIIGMVYLCEAGILYVSTVLGSDRQTERGALYAIDVKAKKIVDKISSVDVMGMGITYITGKRQLFVGSGRSSSVFAIRLTKEGRFSGELAEAFSLAGLGSRGDDKVRRIRTNEDGNLLVYGVDFNYNLIAPTEKQETTYSFNYDPAQDKWQYIPIAR